MRPSGRHRVFALKDQVTELQRRQVRHGRCHRVRVIHNFLVAYDSFVRVNWTNSITRLSSTQPCARRLSCLFPRPPALLTVSTVASMAPPDQPNRDADGCVSPMLAIDSSPSAFDDLDADPTSSHNSMAHANGSLGYAPPTQRTGWRPQR